MKTSIEIGLSFGMLLLLATAAGQTVNSDSWAATDALGRKVCEYGEAGDRKRISSSPCFTGHGIKWE